MTIATSALQSLHGGVQLAWATELDSSSATPLEKKGVIRWDTHPQFGLRGFQYLRCDQSGGCTAGQVQSRRANVSAGSITAGTTTTITTSGLTADILVDGILVVTDDAGGAGAAPEGESARVVANTATKITIHSDDAFSAAVASSDTATIILPWAVDDSADGDTAEMVRGVAMTDHDQYDYGWFQFYGIHPKVAITTAALPINESLVADTAALGDGAGDAAELRCGVILSGVSADQVTLFGVVDLFCGAAYKLATSTS